MTSISSGAVLRNTLKLAVGSGFAKLIGLAAMPILTRIYEPESFGMFSVFLSILVIVTPLYTLRYSVAIPMTKTVSEARAVVATCFILIGANFVATLLFLYIFGDAIFKYLNAPDMSSIWIIVPISLVLGAVLEVALFKASRDKDFSLLGKNTALQSVFGSIFQIALGVSAVGLWGLIIGHSLKMTSGLIHMVRSIRLDSTAVWSIGRKKFFFVLKKYSDLPKYRLITQLTFGVAAQVPIFFCARMYGLEQTGQAALAFMAIAVPITVLGASTSKAYYAEIGRLRDSQASELLKVTKKVVVRQLIFAFPLAISIFFLSPLIFPIVFGEEWEVAGKIASLLSISMLFQFLYTSVSDAMVVTKKMIMQMINQFVRLTLATAAFLLSWVFGLDILGAFGIYALFLAFSYSWGLMQVFSSINTFASKA